MKSDINWYLNKAKNEQNIKSDRKLATALEVATVADFRNPYRHSVPSQNLMIRIAHMAKVPDEIALIDRDIWEANYKAPETVPVYQKIKEALKSLPNIAAMLTIAFAILFSPFDFDGGNSAFAGEKVEHERPTNIYYGTF